MLARLGMAVMVLAMVSGMEAQNSGNPSSVTVAHFVAPQYPVAAWLGHVEGEVTAELTIGLDGSVQSVEVAP